MIRTHEDKKKAARAGAAINERSSVVELFEYNSTPVRTIVEDGEPWFVASDVAKILGYANGSAAVAQHVDSEDARRATLAIHEGSREVSRARTLVNESGLYALTFGSHLSEARKFRRWVTSEVLPTIRKTGSYGGTPELTGPELMAKAILEAESTLKEKDAKIAELEPKAERFDGFLGSTGDMSVGDAAKHLCRIGIDIGPRRLFAWLEEHGWLFRQGKHKAPVPYQSKVDAGFLASRVRSYMDQETGELVIADPQVRVTSKGLERIHRMLSKQFLELVS
ncbi:hypothetical protein GMA10_05885 [Kocuria koreensis]|uniref:Bro-N domain-containing protein n=1 Tax=Rothia koreensis TaxID=592378 RepID=A0A7K1LII4_9MICC|nr:phage antirepressor KilAC domain-containing protein [Rothia koreensis]MUN54742.1 hypothetical protein [Rothia koreensis]